jgi:hypothetical protein
MNKHGDSYFYSGTRSNFPSWWVITCVSARQNTFTFINFYPEIHYLFSRLSLHISKKTPPSISPPIKTNERKMCVRWVLTISYTNFWLMEFFRRLKKNFLCDYHNKNRPGFLLCTLRFFFYLSERIHRYYTHTHTQVPFSCVCVHAEASPH